MKTGEFEYREGVVMNQILLADEINRTSPKTQASLLEAMAEGDMAEQSVKNKAMVQQSEQAILTLNGENTTDNEALWNQVVNKYDFCEDTYTWAELVEYQQNNNIFMKSKESLLLRSSCTHVICKIRKLRIRG